MTAPPPQSAEHRRSHNLDAPIVESAWSLTGGSGRNGVAVSVPYSSGGG
ncbi:MAG: hypothetical protein LJE94_18615 [Deltaproteobacteria bacterium]|nr:hypothetical protein [Deltaproteobacteria bacterium]